jgi:hypothetical protein
MILENINFSISKEFGCTDKIILALSGIYQNGMVIVENPLPIL